MFAALLACATLAVGVNPPAVTGGPARREPVSPQVHINCVVREVSKEGQEVVCQPRMRTVVGQQAVCFTGQYWPMKLRGKVRYENVGCTITATVNNSDDGRYTVSASFTHRAVPETSAEALP
jgi:hypothetical protein